MKSIDWGLARRYFQYCLHFWSFFASHHNYWRKQRQFQFIAHSISAHKTFYSNAGKLIKHETDSYADDEWEMSYISLYNLRSFIVAHRWQVYNDVLSRLASDLILHDLQYTWLRLHAASFCRVLDLETRELFHVTSLHLIWQLICIDDGW